MEISAKKSPNASNNYRFIIDFSKKTLISPGNRRFHRIWGERKKEKIKNDTYVKPTSDVQQRRRMRGRVAPEIRREAMAAADGGGAYGGKRLQVIGVCWEGRGVGRMK